MESAGLLAREGYAVTLFEKETYTGGHTSHWYHLFPDRRESRDIIKFLEERIDNSNLNLLTGLKVTTITKKHGFFLVYTEDGNEFKADAVILSTGFDLFNSSRKEEYGYGIYDNVISSADLETMFRAGEIKLANGKAPETVGFVHCVGSRDEKVGNLYCSKLCCVTAVKQAIEVREHLQDTKVFCFYMDMRMGGAYYEELYREAQEQWNVSFIRGKVSEVSEDIDNRLVIKSEDTLAGKPLKIHLDMLVLMAGMEMSEGGAKIAAASGLHTGQNRFFASADHHYGSNKSNVKGIFYAGTCTMPMNITETISHARAAVSDVIDYLEDRN